MGARRVHVLSDVEAAYRGAIPDQARVEGVMVRERPLQGDTRFRLEQTT